MISIEKRRQIRLRRRPSSWFVIHSPNPQNGNKNVTHSYKTEVQIILRGQKEKELLLYLLTPHKKQYSNCIFIKLRVLGR